MIGIFDSGLGGLTAYRELRSIMPTEDIVYFGDTARIPYGTKSTETVREYALQDASFLCRFDPRAILVACGTVSSVAIDTLKEKIEIPVIGVVEPAAKKAAEITKNGKIGILGTNTTIKSKSIEKKIIGSKKDIEITAVSCPLLVSIVEYGFAKNDPDITKKVCERYLEKIIKNGCDTVVLGCTHFPILKDYISDIIPGVMLVNSGEECAKEAKRILPPTPENETGKDVFYVSDNADDFNEIASYFLDTGANMDVRKIDISNPF